MPSHDLVPARGGGLTPWSPGRRAGKEIARVNAYGATLSARQQAKLEVVGGVARGAVEEFGGIAMAAEFVLHRTPTFGAEAALLVRQGAMALGRVIEETERMW